MIINSVLKWWSLNIEYSRTPAQRETITETVSKPCRFLPVRCGSGKLAAAGGE